MKEKKKSKLEDSTANRVLMCVSAVDVFIKLFMMQIFLLFLGFFFYLVFDFSIN